MKSKSFLWILAVFFLATSVIAEPCNIYFFYSPTCPHCAQMKPFLEKYQDEYPEMQIDFINVNENYERFESLNEEYGSIAVGVPRLIINEKVFVGFVDEEGPMEYVKGYQAYNGYKNQIEDEIVKHLKDMHLINESLCDVPSDTDDETSSTFLIPAVLVFLYIVFAFTFWKKIERRYIWGSFFALVIILFFYLSQFLPSTDILSFAKNFSFPVFTFIIALLDGFNPCAFAVLAILLSLLIHAQSKKKMALIGSIFILTSAVMYFIFIVALLTLRTEILGGHKDIIRIIAGLVAIVAGVINIKDFFFFKKGVSLTISKKKMSRLMGRMREVVNQVKEATTAKSMIFAVVGTIILAALVNLIELGCTLILPVQYIEFLITNYGTNLRFLHYVYIAGYSLVYVVPLFAILGSFLYTFKSERVTQEKGKLLKLISGLVMLGLGVILVFKPELILFG